MIELAKETERVILVGVCVSGQEDTEDSLEELKDLADTAGADTVGRLIQNREQVHPGTYIGKGKIEELKDLLWELDATGIWYGHVQAWRRNRNQRAGREEA